MVLLTKNLFSHLLMQPNSTSMPLIAINLSQRLTSIRKLRRSRGLPLKRHVFLTPSSRSQLNLAARKLNRLPKRSLLLLQRPLRLKSPILMRRTRLLWLLLLPSPRLSGSKRRLIRNTSTINISLKSLFRPRVNSTTCL